MKQALADLLWDMGRPLLHYLWVGKERWPKLFGGAWRMAHQPEWHKSSLQSGLLWMLGTLIIFKLVAHLGHGLTTNIVVSLSMDLVAYGLNKLWIWRQRNITLPCSLARNMQVWLVFFGVNLLAAWQAIDHLGTHHGRYALGAYGVVMNPFMFKARDRLVFAETSVSDAVTAGLEAVRGNERARRMLLKFGMM